jgi:hypothetical protein
MNTEVICSGCETTTIPALVVEWSASLVNDSYEAF